MRGGTLGSGFVRVLHATDLALKMQMALKQFGKLSWQKGTCEARSRVMGHGGGERS